MPLEEAQYDLPEEYCKYLWYSPMNTPGYLEKVAHIGVVR